MIAFKGFNADMTCTKGEGKFRYEVGKTYEEGVANVARNGFHCVEEPIRVLDWYPDGVWCEVEAAGDINEVDDKISCTKITINKTLSELALHVAELEWIAVHPNRETSSRIKKDVGRLFNKGIIIVRGKAPKAAGPKGSTLLYLKECEDTSEIAEMGAFQVDDKFIKANKMYDIDGRRV